MPKRKAPLQGISPPEVAQRPGQPRPWSRPARAAAAPVTTGRCCDQQLNAPLQAGGDVARLSKRDSWLGAAPGTCRAPGRRKTPFCALQRTSSTCPRRGRACGRAWAAPLICAPCRAPRRAKDPERASWWHREAPRRAGGRPGRGRRPVPAPPGRSGGRGPRPRPPNRLPTHRKAPAPACRPHSAVYARRFLPRLVPPGPAVRALPQNLSFISHTRQAGPRATARAPPPPDGHA